MRRGNRINLILSFVLFACLTGSAVPYYVLKPLPPDGVRVVKIDGVDFIKASANSPDVGVTADVVDFFGTEYVAAAVIVSNTSSSTMQFSYDSVQILCDSGKNTKIMKPLDPESLIKELAKKRSSHESSRNWETTFLALAAARHGTGETTDISKVESTVENRNAVTQTDSEEAVDMIRYLDKTLLRKDTIEPGKISFGYVFFRFVKSDCYWLRVTVGDEAQEFKFQLRSY